MTVRAVVGLVGALAAGSGPETAQHWVEVIVTPSGRREVALPFGSLVPEPKAGSGPVKPVRSDTARLARPEGAQRPTCTVRVLPADPRVDPGMAVTAPQDVDPRMTVTSRCAE
jgi:hypothetical protein